MPVLTRESLRLDDTPRRRFREGHASAVSVGLALASDAERYLEREMAALGLGRSGCAAASWLAAVCVGQMASDLGAVLRAEPEHHRLMALSCRLLLPAAFARDLDFVSKRLKFEKPYADEGSPQQDAMVQGFIGALDREPQSVRAAAERVRGAYRRLLDALAEDRDVHPRDVAECCASRRWLYERIESPSVRSPWWALPYAPMTVHTLAQRRRGAQPASSPDGWLAALTSPLQTAGLRAGPAAKIRDVSWTAAWASALEAPTRDIELPPLWDEAVRWLRAALPELPPFGNPRWEL